MHPKIIDEEKGKRDDAAAGSHAESMDQGVTRDGIRLHPQPTADPLDPLNWSRLQKNSILGIVMLKYGRSLLLFLFHSLLFLLDAVPDV